MTWDSARPGWRPRESGGSIGEHRYAHHTRTHTGTRARRWPPYLRRRIGDLIRSPDQPVSVHVGPDAFRRAERCWGGVAMPYGDDPESYDWTPLRGRELVVVVGSDEIQPADLLAVVVALLRAGVPAVMTDEPAVHVGEWH